ncbi:MAG: 30S ribosomal protein S16 [Elusimicrobiota bacterium]|nr:30S ribosomal protein S16 [Elusimicrobiota bacterium]
MVKIRLKRLGAKHSPYYRIVVMPSERRRDGREIEQLGWYDPVKKGKDQYKLDLERAEYWLSKGAQPTEVVRGFIKKERVKSA